MADDLMARLSAGLDKDEEDLRLSADYMGPGCALPGLHLDPPRARCEIDAKRAILAAHPLTTEVIPPGYRTGTGQPFGCETCHDWDGVTEGRGYCDTLLALAAAMMVPVI
jgi:hypothetical protein